jgi:hypothetical protein
MEFQANLRVLGPRELVGFHYTLNWHLWEGGQRNHEAGIAFGSYQGLGCCSDLDRHARYCYPDKI